MKVINKIYKYMGVKGLPKTFSHIKNWCFPHKNLYIKFFDKITSIEDNFYLREDFITDITGFPDYAGIQLEAIEREIIIKKKGEKFTLDSNKSYYLDIETTGLYPEEIGAKILTLTLMENEGGGKIYTFIEPQALQIEGSPICIYGHNILFDITWLDFFNVFALMDTKQIRDSKLNFVFNNENSYDSSLKRLATPKYGYYSTGIKINKLTEQDIRNPDKLINLISYNIKDVLATKYVFDKCPSPSDSFMNFMDLSMRSIAKLQINGININEELLTKFGVSYKEQKERLESDIKLKQKINPNSSKEVRTLLYDVYGAKIIKKTPKQEASYQKKL